MSGLLLSRVAVLSGPHAGVRDVLVDLSLAGASADAKNSRIVVESDGETVEHVSPGEVFEVQWGDFGRWTSKAFVHKWDDGAFVYSLCLELNHGFKQYAKLKIRNGDSANATASVSYTHLTLPTN